MPSLSIVAACFGLAAVCWTVIGFAVTRRIFRGALGAAVAPAMGWAMHSMVAATTFRFIDLGRTPAILLLGCMTLAAGVSCIAPGRLGTGGTLPWRRLAAGALAGAAALAVVPGLLPHVQNDGIALSAPIFDHSKVAFVNAIARSGLPVGNPVFGETGRFSPLPYYYLWHLSAAQIALILDATGWESDIAITWFTAFSSLSLTMAVAVRLSGLAEAALWVLPLAATASIRPMLAESIGYEAVYGITGWPSGFGGWLAQATWAPQHVQSATCVVIACLLISDLWKGGIIRTLALATIASAAFESSIWVGGFAFLVAGTAVCVTTYMSATSVARRHLLTMVVAAAAIAAALALPFTMEQISSYEGRKTGFPVALSLFEVLDADVVGPYARLFDLPAFFSTFLTIELSAVYILAVCFLCVMARRYPRSIPLSGTMRAMVWTVATGLFLSSTLRSTVAENNDLGWRGALPAIMILTSAAAAFVAVRWRASSSVMKVFLVLLIVPGAYQGASFVQANMTAQGIKASSEFAGANDMWNAVRANSDPSERVANNPDFLGTMTAWPINISWALLSARPSCYAGNQFALPFIPLPRRSLEEIDSLFRRVFAGIPQPADLGDMVDRFDCRTVVLTNSDGAWHADPFAASDLYRLVEERPDKWRIYRVLQAAGLKR